MVCDIQDEIGRSHCRGRDVLADITVCKGRERDILSFIFQFRAGERGRVEEHGKKLDGEACVIGSERGK